MASEAAAASSPVPPDVFLPVPVVFLPEAGVFVDVVEDAADEPVVTVELAGSVVVVTFATGEGGVTAGVVWRGSRMTAARAAALSAGAATLSASLTEGENLCCAHMSASPIGQKTIRAAITNHVRSYHNQRARCSTMSLPCHIGVRVGRRHRAGRRSAI